jgi:acetate kinase
MKTFGWFRLGRALPSHMISSDNSMISVHVVRADEELMIARAVCRTIDLKIGRG